MAPSKSPHFIKVLSLFATIKDLWSNPTLSLPILFAEFSCCISYRFVDVDEHGIQISIVTSPISKSSGSNLPQLLPGKHSSLWYASASQGQTWFLAGLVSLKRRVWKVPITMWWSPPSSALSSSGSSDTWTKTSLQKEVVIMNEKKNNPIRKQLYELASAHVRVIWAPSREFVSSSIPSWQILTAHAQPFRGARDLAFCLKVPLDSLLVWASSGGSGETARMPRLAWTFAARIGYKYQIRLTRSIWRLGYTRWRKIHLLCWPYSVNLRCNEICLI